MAQIVQQFGDETDESTKEYLRNLIAMPERKDECVSLSGIVIRLLTYSFVHSTVSSHAVAQSEP